MGSVEGCCVSDSKDFGCFLCHADRCSVVLSSHAAPCAIDARPNGFVRWCNYEGNVVVVDLDFMNVQAGN